MQKIAGIKIFKKFLLLLTTLLIVPLIYCQNNLEVGSQAVNNYSPKEYNGNPQVWKITQDKSGLMYFGTSDAMLVYDGATWSSYNVPNKTIIRSLAWGSEGKLYAGAKADLGYFLPDSAGELIFNSLLKFIPKDKRKFSDVWTIYVSNGKVYFNTYTYLFIWDIQKKKFNVIKGKNDLQLMFCINGTIYLGQWGIGLDVLKGDSLALVKGGEIFANEKITFMLPFPGEKNTILVGTYSGGLFKYDGTKFTSFKTEADEFFKKNFLYRSGEVLSDGNIFLGTLNGGAVVINKNGKEIRKYSSENGVATNTVYCVFQDRSGAIWIGTSNGISRIEYSSPVSYFDSRNGFSNSASDIIRHNDILYIAGNNGIYTLDPHTSTFHLIKNSNTQTWTFIEMANDLIVGTNNGLFKIEADRLIPIRESIRGEYGVNAMTRSKINPDRIYVATSRGLWSVLHQGNKWIDEGRILDFSDQPTPVVENKDGSVWMGTFSTGLFKVTFHKDDKGNVILKNPVVEHFDKKNGLQDGTSYVVKINDINYFATTDSLYKFDENKKMFYPDTTDKIISGFYKITKNRLPLAMQQDKLGRVWIMAKGKVAMGTLLPDGSYKWVSVPFNRFADEIIYLVYAEKNGVTWFGTGESIIKYDFGKKILGKTNFSALVRSVKIGEDSTIYFGEKVNDPVVPEITFKNNSVKFRYSATSYEGKSTNKFKTFLDGFDKSWSQYSTETTKEYTNLPPGKYTFKVAALNILGLEGKTGTYSFKILPPWYRTWLAYILYAFVLTVGIFTVDRTQRRRVVKKERERSEFREAKLRAESENERRKNVELLSEIGKEITATLDLDKIFYKLYEHVNQLVDATIFGVGLYHRDKEEIEYKLSLEEGKRYPTYFRDTKDKNQFPVWCIDNLKPVFINDVSVEYKKYIQNYKKPDRTLEDGTKAKEAFSIIYLPLISKDRLLGVITIQSFQKNAYTDYHLSILETLASYTAIALDNADAYRQLNSTVNDLKTTQEKLVTQEKLASLGALTAGIAHEIKNPLNFVNNFSDISRELLDDIKEELKNKNEKEVVELIEDLNQNLEKINQHGKRADSIVKGMLLHSRGTAGEKILTDVNDLLDQYVALAYHGLRAQNKEFNIAIEKDYDNSLEKVNIVPQDLSRVFLNIINNGCYAAYDKKKKSSENNFTPTLKVSTKNLNGKFEVRIKDNGNGVPTSVKEQIFNPFFTTKPVGEGTGLGLSLSYEIVTKMHGGELKFESEEGKYAEFIIVIPK